MELASVDWCYAPSVKAKTRELWAKQNQHQGDRSRLFRAVSRAIEAAEVLYPGSYVDIAPSFVFPSVTYVDMDRRAASFFADEEGVREIIASQDGAPKDARFRFIHSDYSAADLGLPLEGSDLLVSMYGGFISEHCTQYLRPGGTLLVNPSHGDAAMASIDPRYQLSGVVVARAGDYRVSASNLDSYLIPKMDVAVTRELLHETGRGIAYTKSAFAYLFQRVE